ncbi:MAG: hypothetical protein J6S71_10110 [Clostridia bacterium]|nr:hypothetical protein [Clostridia bacterium]
MKTRTKALLLVMSALLLVVSTVFATMAYLTSSVKITNTFTVGNVTITMDETDVNAYGDSNGTRSANGNQYKLIPGHRYIKDPIIHVVAGSEECYLFVKLEDGLADIQDADTIATQMVAAGWEKVSSATNVWVYTKTATHTVDARNEAKDVPLFTYFKLLGTADVASYGSANITVQACAIQADGFPTWNDAWTTGLSSTFPTVSP